MNVHSIGFAAGERSKEREASLKGLPLKEGHSWANPVGEDPLVLSEPEAKGIATKNNMRRSRTVVRYGLTGEPFLD